MEWWYFLPLAAMLAALAWLRVRAAKRTYMNIFDRGGDDGKK